MMNKLYVLLAFSCLLGCEAASDEDGAEVSTSHVVQSLSACLDGDGRNLTCTTGSTGCGGNPTFVHWCVSGQMP